MLAVLVGYGFSIIYIGQLCNHLIGLPIIPITGMIIRVSLFRSGYIIGLALLFFYQSQAIQKERRARIMEQEYERSRINQHLVFNTLSFMYEALQQRFPQVAETAFDLSDILRYSLRQSGSTGKVSVIDEVEQMQRYIPA
ncbi:histidine kinase [Mucilaginibacter sp. UC70_90]